MDAILQYSSSDDESKDSNLKSEVIGNGSRQSEVTTLEGHQPRIELPDAIKHMFDDPSHHAVDGDRSELHQGRVRSFPHERGNWATSVYIEVSSGFINSLTEELALALSCRLPDGVTCHPTDSHHISLSRTVCLKQHWIDPITNRLSKLCSQSKRFVLNFGTIEIYVNDERSRTFVGLQVLSPLQTLKSLTNFVDETFKDYHLEKYYENPSFHASLLWMVGDQRHLLTQEVQDQLQGLVSNSLSDDPSDASWSVKQIHIKSGNRLLTLPLL